MVAFATKIPQISSPESSSKNEGGALEEDPG